jgi:hypothetical protein
MMDIIKAEQIENEPIIRRRSERHEKQPLSLFWITHTYVPCEMLCARLIIGICFLNMSMADRCWITLSLMED